MPARVLLVEDDVLISTSLARALVANGYDVELAAGVADAKDSLRRHHPDVVLLDLGLPDGDGIDVCRTVVAEQPLVPVLVLTARSTEVDVVLGLDAGAVDYIIKPFRLAELLARLSSHVRYATAARADPTRLGERIVVGGVTVDAGGRRAFLDGDELQLRPKEFDLLTRLAREPQRVVRREQLIDDVWDDCWWGSTKTLDVHINALRRKLGEAPGAPSRITTVRGVGYRLDPEPS